MRRRNTNRSPIFSPDDPKKKKLKRKASGIFGEQFSPEAWPAKASKVQEVGSKAENEADRGDNEVEQKQEFDFEPSKEVESKTDNIAEDSAANKYLVQPENGNSKDKEPKQPKRRRTKIITKTDSVRKIQAHVRGYLERSGYNTRQKENLQMRVKRRMMMEVLRR